jgi:hypothetical protein
LLELKFKRYSLNDNLVTKVSIFLSFRQHFTKLSFFFCHFNNYIFIAITVSFVGNIRF